MKWKIPGTVLEVDPAVPEQAQELFSSLFLAGGLVLSQVAQITGLEAYMVQNWVKRGFLSPPEKKKYSMDQLCRIIMINMLKSALPMESICSLLSAINGKLDDEGDDSISDSRLYFYFLRLADASYAAGGWQLPGQETLAATLADYEETVPGMRKKIGQALEVMLTAWQSALLQEQAQALLSQTIRASEP